ncbi:MAG TPA: hypothetical protein VGD47_09305 [Steroidobacteraceae bacterium]
MKKFALLGRLRQFARNLGVFVAYDERHYATQASRQLLELYQLERREHPDSSGRLLYEAVVARRLGADSSRAAEVVLRAAESFTDWPVERELRFRHVVHYQIFTEYVRQTSERQGTRTNIGGVVARIIPEEI